MHGHTDAFACVGTMPTAGWRASVEGDTGMNPPVRVTDEDIEFSAAI